MKAPGHFWGALLLAALPLLSQTPLAGCGKTLPIGRFAGETACATKKNQRLAKHGGAGLQPARTFFRILLKQRPTKTREILRFTLNETPEQIVRLLGRAERIDDSVPGYQSWQYESQTDEHDDNSQPNWFVCLRAGDRQILSVTRNFDTPQDVDDLFPAAQTTVHHWPSQDAVQFSLRLRRLSGETLLLAMGTARPGERTSQLILIRRSALKTFMP